MPLTSIFSLSVTRGISRSKDVSNIVKPSSNQTRECDVRIEVRQPLVALRLRAMPRVNAKVHVFVACLLDVIRGHEIHLQIRGGVPFRLERTCPPTIPNSGAERSTPADEFYAPGSRQPNSNLSNVVGEHAIQWKPAACPSQGDGRAPRNAAPLARTPPTSSLSRVSSHSRPKIRCPTVPWTDTRDPIITVTIVTSGPTATPVLNHPRVLEDLTLPLRKLYDPTQSTMRRRSQCGRWSSFSASVS
jgi:hypothetical protein